VLAGWTLGLGLLAAVAYRRPRLVRRHTRPIGPDPRTRAAAV
jgi:hypothetical protein